MLLQIVMCLHYPKLFPFCFSVLLIQLKQHKNKTDGVLRPFPFISRALGTSKNETLNHVCCVHN